MDILEVEEFIFSKGPVYAGNFARKILLRIKEEFPSHINEDAVAKDAVRRAREHFFNDRNPELEQVIAIVYDSGMRFRGIYKEGTGDIDSSEIFPQNLFRFILSSYGRGVWIFHNHPTGSLKDSVPDNKIKRHLDKIAFGLGIVLKHYIITSDGEIEY